MAKRKASGGEDEVLDTSAEHDELLETPDKDEKRVKPVTEEDAARRPERRLPWQEDAEMIARVQHEAAAERDIRAPEDVVGRLDRGAPKAETLSALREGATPRTKARAPRVPDVGEVLAGDADQPESAASDDTSAAS